MTNPHSTVRKNGVVVGCRFPGVSRLSIRSLKAVAALLTTLLLVVAGSAAWSAPAWGDEDGQSGADEGGAIITSQITDTQNLLGGQVGAVTDAIEKTREQTGVSVRLLYLDTFASENNQDPEDWARDVLDSTDPAPDTVMLAVASADGNLVVVVSGDSQSWLKRESTVDALSAAAAGPLTDGRNQDWAGAALAMMDELERQEQANGGAWPDWAVWASLGGGLAVLVALGIGVVVVRHRKGTGAHATSRRHGRKRGRKAKSEESSVRNEEGDETDAGTAPTADTSEITDGIQETSSETGQAGNHE